MALATLGCTIDGTGISAPSYAELLAELQDRTRAIYGSDVAITPDTQDGQYLALLAQAIHDTNQAMIAVYNNLRPSFAQGVPLSSLVRLNGIARMLSSKSAADGIITGVAGTTINNGVVQDENGTKWDLPTPVVIPDAGEISVTVTSQEEGNFVAPAGSINQIATPVRGWQFFLSTSDALPGSPIETDAKLRARQKAAASLTARGNLPGLLAALEDIDGVTRVAVYENTSGAPDANGLVAHSIAVVIEGGNERDIAECIGQRKSTGSATNGTTAQSYTDPETGISYNITFYRLTTQTIPVVVSIKTLDGWNSTVQAAIQQSIADYLSGLGIGVDIQFSRVYPAAYLNGDPMNTAYEITALTVNGDVLDVVIPFNVAAVCLTTDVTFVIAP